MDEFKKYIKENRSRLDVDEPSDDLFEKIETRLQTRKPQVVPMMFKWAAAACIILLAGFGLYKFIISDGHDKQELAKTPVIKIDSPENRAKDQLVNKEQPADMLAEVAENSPAERTGSLPAKTKEKAEPIAAKVKKAAPADPMFKAFADMDKSYATMVSLQLEKVKGTPIYAEDAGYFHVFKKQFQDLTNDEKVLKQETAKSGINNDIISRMINIYQEKISLLKQLQFEINKMNNRVTGGQADTQEKPKPTYINL